MLWVHFAPQNANHASIKPGNFRSSKLYVPFMSSLNHYLEQSMEIGECFMWCGYNRVKARTGQGGVGVVIVYIVLN